MTVFLGCVYDCNKKGVFNYCIQSSTHQSTIIPITEKEIEKILQNTKRLKKFENVKKKFKFQGNGNFGDCSECIWKSTV